MLSTFVNYAANRVSRGAHANDAKGIDIMGNTDMQGPSKRIRIVLADWSS